MKVKANISFFFILFLGIYSYSQSCGADLYLESLKKKNPNYMANVKKLVTEFDLHRKTNKGINDDKIITIPVVFNIVHNGEAIGTGRNVSRSKITEQLDILNKAYSGFYGGADTKIRFCLSQFNDVENKYEEGIFRYKGKASYKPFFLKNFKIEYDNQVDTDLKNNSKQSYDYQDKYLNVWVCDLKHFLGNDALKGYSSFPFHVTTEKNVEKPGVVIDYEFFGLNTQRKSEGKTFVHEVGHWLGLFHTFQNEKDGSSGNCNEVDCTRQGDFVCDTPPVPSEGTFNEAPYNCRGYDCQGGITDAVQNYMDYNKKESCLDKFTLGQKERLRDILRFYKWKIYSNNYTTCGDYNDNGNTGGGTGPNCSTSEKDYYGFKVTAEPYHSQNFDLSQDKLALVSGAGYKIVLFEINDCSLTKESEINFSQENRSFPIESVYLKNNWLLVIKGDGVTDTNYKKNQLYVYRNEGGIYKEKQVIPLNVGYSYLDMKLVDNTLIISDTHGFWAFQYDGVSFSNGNYHYTWGSTHVGSKLVKGKIAFNGEYVAVCANDYTMLVYKKNLSNSFQKLYVSPEQRPFYAVGLSSKSESRLYARSHQLYVYDLNSSTSNNLSLVNTSAFYPGSKKFHLHDDMLISTGNQGVSFHKRFTSDFQAVNVQDANNDIYLTPSPVSSSTSLGNQSDKSGNILAVGNPDCGEIYVYKISDFLSYQDIDKHLCQTPSTSYIQGKNIVFAGGSCAVNVEERLDVLASESIKIKAGTSIKRGSVFTAKVGTSSTCKLTGGIKLDGAPNGAGAKSSTKIIHTYPNRISNTSRVDEEVLPFKIYPNPTSNILYLESSSGIKINSISINTLSGNKVSGMSFEGKNKLQIDVSSLSKGVYLLQIKTDRGLFTEKIIIQ